MAVNLFITQKLEERKKQNSFRVLKENRDLIDFCSNDYLGFARLEELKSRVETELKGFAEYKLGSTGSRLLAGHTEYANELEKKIAKFHSAEAGLIFNSGYDANIGLFSSLPQRHDTIISDELAHASIIDGCRLSHANRFIFRHNDLESLEQKLKQASGTIFIAVESVYSMDGDFAPLEGIVKLSIKYHAYLIVDEAHATGIFDKNGQGRVAELGIEDRVFARVHTFGKALGSHGAIVLGSQELKDYLINFARSFIYSTALPFHSLVSIKCAYDILSYANDKNLKVKYLINLFKDKLNINKNQFLIESSSPIQCLLFPGNDNCRQAAASLQESGFDIRAILSPTVPEGKERLRICLHSFNTEQQISKLISVLHSL